QRLNMGLHNDMWDLHNQAASNWAKRLYVAEGSGNCFNKVAKASTIDLTLGLFIMATSLLAIKRIKHGVRGKELRSSVKKVMMQPQARRLFGGYMVAMIGINGAFCNFP
ncbi:unnamed protein product, partial [Meganyctiphanes norvegica]